MRTLLLAFFVLLLSSINAQDRILGFGVIKLGKTYEQIVQDMQLKDIREGNNKKMDYSDLYQPKVAVMLQYDSSKYLNALTESFFKKCPDAIILKVPRYTVADITVTDLELTFYKKKLVDIMISSPKMEFVEAFQTKYGKGNIFKDSKVIKCASAARGSFEVEEVSYTTTYESNDPDIKITNFLSDYRDSKCAQQFLSYFRISNTNLLKELSTCETQAQDREAKKKERDLKKLSDF
ncbi:MAG: hypothetical protein JWN76_2978 [Chitinophagaceae bacterium]|nr:hypothetical protein [Chitinophagaceae bacterium]